NRGSAEMSVLVGRLAAVLNELVAHANAHIVFMPTYNVRHENDAAVCESIAGKLSGGSSTLLRLDDPKEYKAVTAHLCLMLCGRMHPAILAAGVGTPVVGLAYNQKFFGMFSLLGQEARCLSASDFVRKDETRRLAEMLRGMILVPASFRPDTAELAAATTHHLEMLISQEAASPVSNEPQALRSQ